MNTNQSHLGHNIRAYRKLRGMNLTDLGQCVGLDNSSLSRIENGKQGITELILQKISKALDVPVAELIEPNPMQVNALEAAPRVPPAAARHPSAPPWHRELMPTNPATQLKLALPDPLKANAAVSLLIHTRKYLCTYFSNKVLVMGATFPRTPEQELIPRPAIDAIYPRVFYKVVLAKHYNRDVVPLSSRHYLAAFIGPGDGLPSHVKKEAGSLDILVEHFADYDALAHRVEELENTPTELEELEEQMENHQRAYDYFDDDALI